MDKHLTNACIDNNDAWWIIHAAWSIIINNADMMRHTACTLRVRSNMREPFLAQGHGHLYRQSRCFTAVSSN